MSGRPILTRLSWAGLGLACAVGASFAPGPGSHSYASVAHPIAGGPALPAAAGDGWALTQLAPAVDAFRAGDLSAARSLLGDGASDPQRALLLGLFAHSKGEFDLATPLLARGHDRTGLLEDWRLFALAEVFEKRADPTAARAALTQLLTTQPQSPLYHRAYRKKVELAYELGDWLGALQGIESARARGLDHTTLAELDLLEWQIANDQALEELRVSTARHLLVEHPIAASQLQVIDTFRDEAGELDWSSFLSAQELLRRARSLLEADIIEGALTTLDAVPASERDLEWTFLRAETLTEDRRGAAALEILEARPPTPHDELDRLWRLRAEAGLDVATVRRGRTNADSELRKLKRDDAWRDLWQLATRSSSEQRVAALRRLYRLSQPEDHFELALDILERLRSEDPEDITGYIDLWKLGWRSFERQDATVAIGIWRELQDLYPEVSTSRQALYWSAVAHAQLGDLDRHRELLRQVLATDTVDFYARHAARRLGVEPLRSLAPPRTHEAIEWPESPTLARAALLSELGLDALARSELELVRGDSEARAVDALEALILARQGDRRESIHAIWRAFKQLGKPGQGRVPASVRQLYYPLDYPELVALWAERRRLPTYLVYGIIRQESAFDAGAISRSGARGLMQLMPATGQELAGKLRLTYSRQRLNDPDFSVQLGTQYFSQVLAMFDGDVELALAGYNGGPYRIRRWWREAGPSAEIDRFVEGLALAETTGYVKRILTFEESYKQLYGDSG